jgi:hypothetical protein
VFAELEGLEAVPLPSRAEGFCLQAIADLLRAHGPLLFSWYAPSLMGVVRGGGTTGHMSVIVGVDFTRRCIIYHDPWNKTGPFEQQDAKDQKLRAFNMFFTWEPYALLYLRRH